MAEALLIIDEDDDGTTRVPVRRKRRAENDPEQFSTVPEGVECNPMAPTKKHKKDQAQPSRAPPLLLQPARPVQIPPQPQPRLKISTQPVPLPTVFQSHSSQSAPQHQPQSNQATAPGPRSPLQHHDEDSVVASRNNGWNSDDSNLGDEDLDANMVDGDLEDVDLDDRCPQEGQFQSDDMYTTPPPPRGQQRHRKCVHDSDSGFDDQPQQLPLRPEGCITFFSLTFCLCVYL
jgi:hypothetical protein